MSDTIDLIEKHLNSLAPHIAVRATAKLLGDAAREIRLLHSFIKHSGVWLPIATAPHDVRILVFTGAEIYAAHWVQNMDTGHEAWMIGEMPDGMQAVVTATHWIPAPKPPQAVSAGAVDSVQVDQANFTIHALSEDAIREFFELHGDGLVQALIRRLQNNSSETKGNGLAKFISYKEFKRTVLQRVLMDHPLASASGTIPVNDVHHPVSSTLKQHEKKDQEKPDEK